MEAREKKVIEDNLFYIDSSSSISSVEFSSISLANKKEADKKSKSNKINPVLIPLDIFNNNVLSPLETTTKYLKENLGLRFSDIASLLNRSQKTIWGAYSSSQTKNKNVLETNGGKIFVPSSALRNRSLSFLESLIEYLKENFNLKYCEIAPLLSRNQRTIWTVYQRARKKRRIIKNAI